MSPINKINGKPISKINGKPINKINTKPINKINGKPVNKINTKPIGPTFLFKLIYKPADCNFRKSGKKNTIPFRRLYFYFFRRLFRYPFRLKNVSSNTES